jgi:hypothetical protein
VDDEGVPSGDRLARAFPQIAAALIVIGLANFFWFIAEASVLGVASDGMIVDGRYFLGGKGFLTEVSQPAWTWSQIHEPSIVATHLLLFAGMLFLSQRTRGKTGVGSALGFADVFPGRVGAVAIIAVTVALVGASGFIALAPRTAPPSGRAPVVPVPIAGRHVYLAPLSDFPAAELQDLAGFYSARYGMQIAVLGPLPVPPPDVSRHQVSGDAVAAAIEAGYPEARFSSNVIIGVLSADIFLPARPDWNWAFGENGDQVSVISTYRMRSDRFAVGEGLEHARLRKMVTRYIGGSYFGLPRVADRYSVLYDNVLSVDDLDLMREDY